MGMCSFIHAYNVLYNFTNSIKKLTFFNVLCFRIDFLEVLTTFYSYFYKLFYNADFFNCTVSVFVFEYVYFIYTYTKNPFFPSRPLLEIFITFQNECVFVQSFL